MCGTCRMEAAADRYAVFDAAGRGWAGWHRRRFGDARCAARQNQYSHNSCWQEKTCERNRTSLAFTK